MQERRALCTSADSRLFTSFLPRLSSLHHLAIPGPSSFPSTSSSQYASVLRSAYHCFPKEVIEGGPYIYHVDCMKALMQISMDKRDAPMIFTRNDYGGFIVPHGWRTDHCMVFLDMTDDSEKPVQQSLTNVVDAALLIMENCITEFPPEPAVSGRFGYGGATSIASTGDDGGSLVVVIVNNLQPDRTLPPMLYVRYQYLPKY